MNWLRNFMMGRYGADQLSFALIILYIVLSITAQICGWWWLTFLLLPLLVFLFWRMFSRNYEARRKENDAFLRIWNPIKTWFKKQKARRTDRTHRYYHCPACSATLRVPKGKGKVSIRCPRCGKEFVKKT
jgi:Type II secretory pathway, component PulF